MSVVELVEPGIDLGESYRGLVAEFTKRGESQRWLGAIDRTQWRRP
jgi:hypothetical protein